MSINLPDDLQCQSTGEDLLRVFFPQKRLPGDYLGSIGTFVFILFLLFLIWMVVQVKFLRQDNLHM